MVYREYHRSPTVDEILTVVCSHLDGNLFQRLLRRLGLREIFSTYFELHDIERWTCLRGVPRVQKLLLGDKSRRNPKYRNWQTASASQVGRIKSQELLRLLSVHYDAQVRQAATQRIQFLVVIFGRKIGRFDETLPWIVARTRDPSELVAQTAQSKLLDFLRFENMSWWLPHLDLFTIVLPEGSFRKAISTKVLSFFARDPERVAEILIEHRTAANRSELAMEYLFKHRADLAQLVGRKSKYPSVRAAVMRRATSLTALKAGLMDSSIPVRRATLDRYKELDLLSSDVFAAALTDDASQIRKWAKSQIGQGFSRAQAIRIYEDSVPSVGSLEGAVGFVKTSRLRPKLLRQLRSPRTRLAKAALRAWGRLVDDPSQLLWKTTIKHESPTVRRTAGSRVFFPPHPS